MKKKICIFNFIIAFVIFLSWFGKTCYLFGTITDFPNGSDLTGAVILTIYFFISLLISVVLIHNQHYNNKALLVGGIYHLAYPVFVVLTTLFLWIANDISGIVEDYLIYIFTIVASLLISALYFLAIVNGKKSK